MTNHLRQLLLASASALGVAALAGGAHAQVQSPGFFGSVTGWYIFDAGNDKDNGVPAFPPALAAAPDNGWGGGALLGYRFSNPWDVAIGGSRSWFTKGKVSASGFSGQADADYWTADGEIGYNFASSPTFGWRLFGGARYAQFDHDDDETTTSSSRHVRFHGIGPRLGADFAWRFSDSSAFSLVGGASGAALFGHVRDTDNVGGARASDSRTVWNADGKLGLDWEMAPKTHVTAGYRADWWRNVGDSSSADKYGGSDRKNDRFIHGPFVRLAYNIGAPTAAPLVAAAPAAPPPPVAQSTGSYIVFFDFDRSTLTPQSQATIKQAADAAKAGNKARLNVTGHADKSGSDEYNMALSLRRANAVKDELVRDGIAATAIIVVGRGESQPLVPTADGVKEPQNRRVEIVLQ